MEFKGELLRAARDAKGLSMSALARRVDVSDDTVYRAEKGLNVPEAATLAKIAAELEISLDDLFEANGTTGEAA